MSKIEEKLDKVYETPVHATYIKDRSKFVKPGHAVYGELLRESVDQLIDILSEHFHKDAVFYDLGCGTGKIVAHVALKTDVSKSIGIELAKIRVEKAREIFASVEFDKAVPEVREASLFTTDVSDATIVYFDTTCFSADEQRQVAARLPKGCVIVYKAFPWLGEPDGTFTLPTSYKPEGAPFNYKIM